MPAENIAVLYISPFNISDFIYGHTADYLIIQILIHFHKPEMQLLVTRQ